MLSGQSGERRAEGQIVFKAKDSADSGKKEGKRKEEISEWERWGKERGEREPAQTVMKPVSLFLVALLSFSLKLCFSLTVTHSHTHSLYIYINIYLCVYRYTHLSLSISLTHTHTHTQVRSAGHSSVVGPVWGCSKASLYLFSVVPREEAKSE